MYREGAKGEALHLRFERKQIALAPYQSCGGHAFWLLRVRQGTHQASSFWGR